LREAALIGVDDGRGRIDLGIGRCLAKEGQDDRGREQDRPEMAACAH
jgi:hypothetical protein